MKKQIEQAFVKGLIDRLNEELERGLPRRARETIAVHAHHFTNAVEYLANTQKQSTSSRSTYYINEG